MAATGHILSSADRRTVLALGAAIIAALAALLAVPSVMADSADYDGEKDLYGYTVTMWLEKPDQVETVEWDFGDGSEHQTVTLTSDNPNGSVKHTYAAKGDYIVTATMRNIYTDSQTGEQKQGESFLTYFYHIHGYPVVFFDSRGGSPVEPIVGTASHYVPTKPADPTNDGLEFTGWYTDKDCTKAFDWTSEVEEHITLYAGWKGVYHTVKLDYNGGLGTESDKVVVDGKTVDRPSDLTRAGYVFDGWYLDGKEFDFSTPIKSDITLTAHWTRAWTVSFDLNGGNGSIASQSVKDGDKVVQPKDPSKDGYSFDGWYLGDSKYDFSSPVTSDITLTAHWTDGSSNGLSMAWIVFAILAIISVVTLVFSGIVFLGIPAVLFAILAIVTFVLYGGL